MRNIETEKILPPREDTGGDRWSQDDLGRGRDNKNGPFHMLLAISASLAVIIAVAAVGRVLVLGTTGAYLVTAANVTIALALVILWGISVGVIFRYIKSLSGKDQVQLVISPEHEG